MKLPIDAKFWNPKFRRKKMAEWATLYSVECVADAFGSSVKYVLNVCKEHGVNPKQPKQPKQISEGELKRARRVSERVQIAKRTQSYFCLACGDKLGDWQCRKQDSSDIRSYCAECAAELFYGKIRLPAQPSSSHWLKKSVGRSRWCPLEDEGAGPWYENARRTYEGD